VQVTRVKQQIRICSDRNVDNGRILQTRINVTLQLSARSLHIGCDVTSIWLAGFVHPEGVP